MHLVIEYIFNVNKANGNHLMLFKVINSGFFFVPLSSVTLRCRARGWCRTSDEIKPSKRVTAVVHLPRLHHTCSGLSVITCSVCSAGVLQVFTQDPFTTNTCYGLLYSSSSSISSSVTLADITPPTPSPLLSRSRR